MIDCSKKPEPAAVLRPCLLVDTREQRPWRFSADVDIERVTLSAGDYSVRGLTELIAIERKSTDDLVQSITRERERFLDECRRLRGFEFRLLIVEASVEDVYAMLYRGRTRPESVIGTTLALFADYGLPTLWAGNAKNAANMAERILTRMWRKRVAETRAA